MGVRTLVVEVDNHGTPQMKHDYHEGDTAVWRTNGNVVILRLDAEGYKFIGGQWHYEAIPSVSKDLEIIAQGRMARFAGRTRLRRSTMFWFEIDVDKDHPAVKMQIEEEAAELAEKGESDEHGTIDIDKQGPDDETLYVPFSSRPKHPGHGGGRLRY